MTQQSNIPNRYQLEGDGIQITYTVNTLAGQPEFDYQDESGTSFKFTGDQIPTQQTLLGTLVSVFLVRTVDQGSISLTLLLPGVNLSNSTQQDIQTVAIVTNNLFSIVGSNTPRQTSTYQIYDLQGSAQFVES